MKDSSRETPGDEKLEALLKTWRSPEPALPFNEGVWRRLSVAQSRNQTRPVFVWRRFNVNPSDAVAALAGVAAGLLLALQLPSHGGAPSDPRFQILHSTSLAGGYMQLALQGEK